VAAQLDAYYNGFVRTFGNVLFAVSLFVVWGLLTLVGVIVDQGKDAAVYFGSYPAPIARASLRLSFDNVYHSPWYVGIIGLILVSLAVCTFKRVIPARLPPLRPVKIEKIPLHASIEVPGEEAGVRARLEAFFRTRGWQLRTRAFDGTEWTFADKHNWARRGVLVAHIGFVIIAAGTTLYWWKGFSGETVVVTGQSVEIPQTKAIVRLDKFAYTITPVLTKGGLVYQPTDYVSHVTVTGKDGIARPMVVRVNHPIDVDSTLYYQASYGFAMRFKVTHNGKDVPALSQLLLLEGQGLEIPGTRLSLSYDNFVPTVDKTTQMPSADPRVTNPAVVISVANGGASEGTVLAMLHSWIDLGGGWRVVPQSPVLYSGFQYRYDPGIPLVGIGALVLVAGLLISFYFLPARLYARVDPAAGGRWTVGLAATTVKGYDMFDSQFKDLVAEFSAETQGASHR